ncbi:hypothetical protein AVEN_263848-1 [Araneus ventricosus]|uniref:Uncharacterized protein n=1 Tax=Araneus ventricosus TaxID=182803 RepID=A0A4Y2DYQ6_ARAVE|nr:hypothetical protein AVEN_263848-1 [Araneus ventricosus]
MVVPNFLLKLLQQFFSFVRSMGIVMQEDDTITQHARLVCVGWLHGDQVTISFFRNSRNTYLAQGSLQTVMWKQLQGHHFYHVGLNKLVLHSDKRLNRFSDYVE